MVSSTVTRKPANGVRTWMDGDFAHHALEPGLTVDDPPGADRNADIVLTAAVVATGLSAGLFYTFTTAVMPGLMAADERTLVAAMQRMIDNPVFPLTFLGAGALTVVALVQARRSGSVKTAQWIGVGLVLYAVTVAVTSAIHLPLNEGLMRAGDPDRIEDLAAMRDDFATPWVAWDRVRTLASTAAFACLAWALAVRGRTRLEHARRRRASHERRPGPESAACRRKARRSPNIGGGEPCTDESS